MEIIMTLIVLIIIFTIAFLIGAKQGSNRTINQIKKDGGYYDMEYTPSVYPILDRTSSLDEVPEEFLMSGDIDRILHIAGVKEATPAKLQEWQDERKVKAEVKQEVSVDDLLSKLNKTDLQIKAGIIENTDKTGPDIKIQVKEIDASDEISFRIEAARKENDREREQRVKIDFDALNFSRISNEARKQITEIVKQDLENKIKEIEKNTPEINEDNGIGKKPKTQTDYQKEHKVEGETPAIDFMHNWIQEKSGKKKPNPKQMDGIESDKPFVKTRKRKPKTTKEWEDEFDIGGNS
jgi:hypothetical protein